VASKKRVKGVGRYIRRLNREINKIGPRTLKGLIRAGIIVIRGTEKTPPLTPLDTGNLRASRFLVTSRGGTSFGGNPQFKGDDSAKMAADHGTVLNSAKADAISSGQPMVVLGYTAHYAAEVHENVSATFQRPGAGAKFLQASLRRNEKEMLRVIAEEAKIK
jgi:hypothetical protein